MKCIDCNIESDDHKGWYADFTEVGKLMRCPSCGKKEYDQRHKMLYGQKTRLDSIEEVDKQDRIQYAKDLRKKGLSPWQNREAEGQQGARI